MTTSESDHDELYDETQRLFKALLAKAHHILKAGTTQNQITLIKQVIPVLMREMQEQQSRDENKETQAALDNLFSQARQQLDPSKPPAPTDL
jgi:hypothetical protein